MSKVNVSYTIDADNSQKVTDSARKSNMNSSSFVNNLISQHFAMREKEAQIMAIKRMNESPEYVEMRKLNEELVEEGLE